MQGIASTSQGKNEEVTESPANAQMADAARESRVRRLAFGAGEVDTGAGASIPAGSREVGQLYAPPTVGNTHTGQPLDQSVHPLQDHPPKLGAYFKLYSNGTSSQLGPFLSSDLSWMDTAPEDVLTRAPPMPFGTFESLSNAALDIVEVAGGGAPLPQRRYTIILAGKDSRGYHWQTALKIERSWYQIYNLVEAVRTNGDPGAENLKGLEPSESVDEKRMAVRLLKLSEALGAVIQKHPTAVELHAFLGWGVRGEEEVCTVDGLRQRQLEMIDARQTARTCKEAREKRLADAQAVAADHQGNLPVRETLQVLKMSELRKRAIAVGIKEDKLEEYYDLDQPKVAIVDAIMEAWEDPQRLTRTYLLDARRPVAVLVSGTGIAWVDGVYFQVDFHKGFPYYKNKDGTNLCRCVDWSWPSKTAWYFQRVLGAASCSAYLDRWDNRNEVPLGALHWWCIPAPSVRPDSATDCEVTANHRSRWAVRHVTISALCDDANAHAREATLFPEFFRVPQMGNAREQKAAHCSTHSRLSYTDGYAVDAIWAHTGKFLSPSPLHDAVEPVQFEPPISPPNDYAAPQSGGLIPANMLMDECRDVDGHGLSGEADPSDEKWGELTLDEACRLAESALAHAEGLISLEEGLAVVAC